ncbi:ankyrin repeat-containing domain protein [Rhypophila decipiens]|uniref:Ankyrin repeat-containing domain protein n=1 Tax=Rhypophila decipiens TaxID=261697 RepID=A0AAN6YCV7_9PEZI|nr:ankyrin repeat-containing domain protein [Rhypophila decipiens]
MDPLSIVGFVVGLSTSMRNLVAAVTWIKSLRNAPLEVFDLQNELETVRGYLAALEPVLSPLTTDEDVLTQVALRQIDSCLKALSKDVDSLQDTSSGLMNRQKTTLHTVRKLKWNQYKDTIMVHRDKIRRRRMDLAQAIGLLHTAQSQSHTALVLRIQTANEQRLEALQEVILTSAETTQASIDGLSVDRETPNSSVSATATTSTSSITINAATQRRCQRGFSSSTTSFKLRYHRLGALRSQFASDNHELTQIQSIILETGNSLFRGIHNQEPRTWARAYRALHDPSVFNRYPEFVQICRRFLALCGKEEDDNKAGADIEEPAHLGILVTPLFSAVMRGYCSVVSNLISAGADVRRHRPLENGATLIPASTMSGEISEEMTRLLLLNGADPNERKKETGWSALHTLHEAGDFNWTTWENGRRRITGTGAKKMEYLIQAGADINLVDWAGQSPLLYQIRHNEAGYIRGLLEHGADVGVLDKDGRGLLHSMGMYAMGKTIKVFREFHGEICAKDGNENDGHANGFADLLVALKDKMGMTASEYFRERVDTMAESHADGVGRPNERDAQISRSVPQPLSKEDIMEWVLLMEDLQTCRSGRHV